MHIISLVPYSGNNSFAGTLASVWSMITLNRSVEASTKMGLIASMNLLGFSLKKFVIKSAKTKIRKKFSKERRWFFEELTSKLHFWIFGGKLDPSITHPDLRLEFVHFEVFLAIFFDEFRAASCVNLRVGWKKGK